MGCEPRAAVGARKGRWPDTCDAPERGEGRDEGNEAKLENKYK